MPATPTRAWPSTPTCTGCGRPVDRCPARPPLEKEARNLTAPGAVFFLSRLQNPEGLPSGSSCLKHPLYGCDEALRGQPPLDHFLAFQEVPRAWDPAETRD